jgi:hypothetical protein
LTLPRSDLEAALTVLGGPEAPGSKAFRWSLPPARHEHLAKYCIGYVLEDPAVPLSAETRSVLEAVVTIVQRRSSTDTSGLSA